MVWRRGSDEESNAQRQRVRRLISLSYNDGTPVETKKINALKKHCRAPRRPDLLSPRTEGLWKIGKATFRDEMVVCRILSEEVRESREYFLQLKEEIQRDFQQAEVLIVERKVEVL